MNTQKPVIFVSHAHSDKEIANAVESLIKKIFGQRAFDIFISSNGTSIQLGDDWRNKILEKLEQAQIVIVILTPESEEKSWISVEAGGAWTLRKRIITCFANGSNKLPSTLQHIQGGLELEKSEDLKRMIDALDQIIGFSPENDQIIDVCAKIAEEIKKKNSKKVYASVALPLATTASTTPLVESTDKQISVHVLTDRLYKALDNPVLSPAELIESLYPDIIGENEFKMLTEKLAKIITKSKPI